MIPTTRWFGTRDEDLEPLRNAVGYLPFLEELEWLVRPEDFCSFKTIRCWGDAETEGEDEEGGTDDKHLGPGFRCLRRLTFGPTGWNAMVSRCMVSLGSLLKPQITNIPKLPELESMYSSPPLGLPAIGASISLPVVNFAHKVVH